MKKANNIQTQDEEEEPLLIYTTHGSPFRCEKLPAINGNPEHNNIQKLHYSIHIIIILNIQEKLRSAKKLQNTCVGDQIQALSKSQIVLIYIIFMYIRYRHWLSVKKDYIQF